MPEGKAETTETTEKSPDDIAREKVAPKGYTWLTNYPPYKSERELKNWVADLKRNDQSITDIKIIDDAFNAKGERITDSYAHAAYITREPATVSALEPTEPKSSQSFISRALRRK